MIRELPGEPLGWRRRLFNLNKTTIRSHKYKEAFIGAGKDRIPSKHQMMQHLGEIGADDGVDPRELEKQFKKELIQSATRPNVDRKALQLCRQVERVLMFVVPDLVTSDLDSGKQAEPSRTMELLLTSEILGVIPAPRTNHLLATIQISEASSETEIKELEAYLKSRRGQIRAEVAASINRRKTPDISFRVVNPDA